MVKRFVPSTRYDLSEEDAMDQPVLSRQEWSLVLQLLREEQDELPTELHHTDSRDLAEVLEQRKKMVDSLVDRLENLPMQ